MKLWNSRVCQYADWLGLDPCKMDAKRIKPITSQETEMMSFDNYNGLSKIGKCADSCNRNVLSLEVNNVELAWFEPSSAPCGENLL
ncbi:UNVERIFIED_CONTAM: hypothetical protein K2H54_064790 [Gekko kuhli]